MASSSASAASPPPLMTPLLVLIMAFCATPSVAFMSPTIHSRSSFCFHSLGHSRRSLSHVEKNELSNHLLWGQTRQSSDTITSLHLFGNIFGKDDVEEDQNDLQENELARFSHLLPSDASPTVKFDSMSIMISEWAKLFTDDDKKMGLTTPVVVMELKKLQTNTGSDEKNDVTDYSGVQLLFQKRGGRSAYQDKDKKENSEKEEGSKKDDTIKEGGVEVRVEQLSGRDLQVIASRCEIEEGTMVKEMSEQTIIDSLRQAMAAWKKEQLS